MAQYEDEVIDISRKYFFGFEVFSIDSSFLAFNGGSLQSPVVEESHSFPGTQNSMLDENLSINSQQQQE